MLKNLLAVLMFVAGSALGASSHSLPDHHTRDWSQVAGIARADMLPVVVLVSSPECGYCNRLKRDVLAPLQASGKLGKQAVWRELDLNSGGKLVDFDGERVRARIFVGRYQVFATPTLLFLGPDGIPLRAPLVGFNGKDAYGPLLDQALSESGRSASSQ